MIIQLGTDACYVYALYNDHNELMYVGYGMEYRLSATLKERGRKHLSLRLVHSKSMSRKRAKVLEAFLILVFKPKLNKKLQMPDGLIDFCYLQYRWGNGPNPKTLTGTLEKEFTRETLERNSKYKSLFYEFGKVPEAHRMYSFEILSERRTRLRRQRFMETNMDRIELTDDFHVKPDPRIVPRHMNPEIFGWNHL